MIADRHALPTRLKHFLTLPIALLAIVLAAQPAASQNHLWSQQLGGTGGESGNAVAVDSKGNVVVTGYFTDSVDFGGGNLTSAGILDVFLAKYDAYGVHQWSKRFGATQTDNGLAVVVDANLNVLFAGSFKGTVDFGGGSLIAAGSEDIFLAKFDAAGVHQWSLGFGDTDPDQCSGIAVDDAGNVYITGHFRGTVDFGGGSLVSEGLKEIFLAKYDANGTHVWSQSFGNEFDDVGRAVEIDPAGNVIVTGSFTARVDFGGGNLSGVGETPDIFLV